ncbi:MAG: adenosylmethionine decarboxylase [Sulfolobales archaeon]
MGGSSAYLPVGRHLYANLYDADPSLLGDERILVDSVLEALKQEGINVVDVKSWSFGGKKGGVSVIAVLEGAHVVIHTWVGYRYATLDVLVTGDHDPARIFERVKAVLKPRSYKVGFTYRGGTGGERELTTGS